MKGNEFGGLMQVQSEVLFSDYMVAVIGQIGQSSETGF